MSTTERDFDLVAELGTFVLPGRVSDPRAAIEDAVAAERAGYGTVWVSERYDLKDIGVLSGAVCSATSRIGFASGVVAAGVRHPLLTASWAATSQAVFGPRLTVGLGRGVESVLAPQGMHALSLAQIEDYAQILRRLWSGETVSYDGPLGKFPAMRLADRTEQPPPRLILGCLGGPRAVEVAARAFDGVFLVPFLTPDAVHETRVLLDDAARRAGRDPAELALIHEIVTAPDMERGEVLETVHARALGYLQLGDAGPAIIRRNHWDAAELAPVFEHPIVAGLRSGTLDQGFHREQLVEVAGLLPEHWITPNAALGSPAECVARIREYVAAGADEIVVHGAPPQRTADVVRVWREQARAGV